MILALLATLPAGMRATVVLRYVEGLSVAETADAMGCSSAVACRGPVPAAPPTR
jgi:DNA-directed RNA polymerase specialized sigma24 family protein